MMNDVGKVRNKDFDLFSKYALKHVNSSCDVRQRQTYINLITADHIYAHALIVIKTFHFSVDNCLI